MKENPVALILALASIGLGVITFLAPALRVAALLSLTLLLLLLFLTLRLEQFDRKFQKQEKMIIGLQKEISRVLDNFDIHKKVFKLEERLKQVMKSRKGEWNPLWGVAIIAILILLFFILKASGIF